MNIFLFSGLIFLGNLFFGWWRSGVKRFSLSWLSAIHIPVLIVIATRLAMHMPYKLTTIPLTVTAFFLGQYSGGIVRKRLSAKGKDSLEKQG